MHAPGQQAQHAGCIFTIGGLSKDRSIHHNDRVRTQHHVLRPRLPDCQRFFARQPLSAAAGRFANQRSFVNIRRLHGKRNACLAQ